MLSVLRALSVLGVLGVLWVPGCSSSGCSSASALPPPSLPVPCRRCHLPLCHREGGQACPAEVSPEAGAEPGQVPSDPAAAPAPPRSRDANARRWSVLDKSNVCSS